MPIHPSQLEPASGAALTRLRAHFDSHGGPAAFAANRSINPRTAERLYQGTRSVPRWLLAEIEQAAKP